jgi:acid stress-induced BolA-like protein IbaG/YrbA
MDIKSTVRQYLRLKDEAALLTNRTNQLKEELLAAVDSVEFDDRGHKKMVVEDEFKGEVTLTKQRRVSKNLDMSIAEDILTAKGIKDKCIKMIPTLDESSIMSAFYEGLLTEEDIDAMFPAKVTYAFLVDAK